MYNTFSISVGKNTMKRTLSMQVDNLVIKVLYKTIYQLCKLIACVSHIAVNIYSPFCRSVWIQDRCGAWWKHVITSWTDFEWKGNFRMSKTTFLKLCDILKPYLKKQQPNLGNQYPLNNVWQYVSGDWQQMWSSEQYPIYLGLASLLQSL